MFRRIASIVVLVGACVVVGVTPAAAAPVPVLQNCSYGASQVRPSRVTLLCGDGGAWVQDIDWLSWGSAGALGTGVLWTNVCRPNCASGNYTQEPATIRLGGLTGDRFTTATVTGAHATSTIGSSFRVG
ncbi:hypothetical protein [Tsukamurella soli]|uniref:Ig-like domain-containing protein n=1 Tax=Tsukamurella soli TaxID=644556 RepID=A0ABP8JBL0_9ACTN